MAIKISGTTVIDDTRNLTSINTTASGNTTVTGFLNVSSTGQFGGAVSGITTLAAGNTTVTGFVNSTSTGQFGGNVTVTGTVNATGNAVANAFYAGALLIGNSTVINATHLGGVAAASYLQNTDSRTLSGSLTFNGANTVFANLVTFTDTTSQSTTDASAWFSGTGGSIAFDTNMCKRISWNDGNGNFNIRAGHYYNGTSTLYVNDGTSGGAALFQMGSDATEGAVTLAAYPIAASGATVTGGSSVNLTPSYFSVSTANAGIGNTTPAHKLTVGGDTYISSNLGIGNTTVSGAKMTVSGETGILVNGATVQYPVGLNIPATGHATSERAAVVLGDWSVGQDTAGNGTKDFYIYGGTSPSAKFYIDTAGEVGIGNVAPNHKLSVNGTGYFGSSLNVISTFASGNATITGFANVSGDITGANVSANYYTKGSAPLAIGGSGGTPVVQLHSTGTTFAQAGFAAVNWGIGVAAPGLIFAKTKTGIIGSYTDSQQGDVLGEIRWSSSNSTSFMQAAAIRAEAEAISSGANGSGALVFETSNTSLGTSAERLRISSNGNIGIGNAAPVDKLSVNGDTYVTGNVTATSVYTGNWFRSTGASGWYSQTYGGGIYMNDTTQVKTYGNKRFWAGAFAGTTAVSTDTSQIQVQNGGGTGDADVACISFHCSGTYGSKMHLRADGYFGIGGWSANAWRWYVYLGDGSMTAAGNVTAYSDIRLKENISKLENALSKIKKLNGVRFNWKDIPDVVGSPGKADFGVLAHEVEAVAPEVISSSPHTSPDGDPYKTVAYDKLVPLLIEAIKDLSSQVDDLKEQVRELKSL